MQINENIQNQIIKNISGSGDLVKTGEGTLTIAGTNTFDGDFLIQEGSAAFTNNGTDSYIAGITNISYGASLLYSTDSPSETISKILGSGNFVKSGTGNLTFNYVNEDDKFSGNAVAEAGTLTVNAASGASDKFDFNMLAAGGNIVYNAISGQLYTISGNSKIGFDKYSGSVTFNNGTYNLESALSGMESDNQKVIFDGGSTIKLTNTDYTRGAYILKDALIDLSDGAYNNYTFNNLSTEEGVQLKVDLSFNTINGHNSDILISENGTGLVTLTQLNLKDIFDDGVTVPPDSVTFDILGGGLKLNENTSLQDFATDVYHYDVSISDDKQSIILTADGAAHENSLQAQNIKEHDSRNFQFLKDETYTIGDHLGNTAAGIFTVNGIKNADGTITTHIHGGEQYSMFNVVNNTQLSLNDMEISHASKDGNGSVLNHTHSEGVSSITNAYIHDSESTGLGGAVYAAGGQVVLEDVVFADNTHGTGVNASANDIYIDKSGTITYNAATTGKNSISSGIAGDGNLVKTGSSELNLSGNNKNFYGNLYVTDGTLNFTQNSADDTYIAGVTVLQEKGNAVIDAAKSDVTPGAFVGGENNEITKTGSYDMILSGDNSGFKGTANIEEGDVVYNTDTSTFFGGSTILGAEDTGILVKGSKDALVSNISGSGAIIKENSGTLYLSGDNSNFNGTLDVTKGTFALAAGTQLGTISSGNFAAGTSINLQNTSAVQGSDGKWTTSPNPASIESVNFDTLEINGDVGLSLDVDLANSQSDKITANTVKSENDGRLVIGGNSLNIVSDSLVKDTKTQIVSGNIAQYVYLDDAARTAMGPIQKYMVDFTNDGYLSFTAQGGNTPSYGNVNPAVMASPVAAQLGGYLVQLNSYDQAFHNMDMYMLMTKEQRQAMKLRNKYASANSDVVFDPTVTRYEEKSGWFRPYATFESVRLDNGPKVSNVAYGSFFGAESELYDLGHGWDGMWGVYAGYNGSHQAYDGIGIYQNGGTLGVVGMAYKGNFFTGLTANSGASVGEAQSSFGQDNFTMLMAGIASKSGYNFELADGKLIIQPNFMMSYSFVNTFDYHNSAGVSISSAPLHAIHLEPGIKIIGNLKNGWQPYAGVSMIWNIMDNTQFMANEVSLPDLSVKPYVKYGVGVRKSWGERFTGFFQTYITNGGRNGVGLQLGFRMMFGGKPAVKNSAGSSPVKKKVIKAMK